MMRTRLGLPLSKPPARRLGRAFFGALLALLACAEGTQTPLAPTPDGDGSRVRTAASSSETTAPISLRLLPPWGESAAFEGLDPVDVEVVGRGAWRVGAGRAWSLELGTGPLRVRVHPSTNHGLHALDALLTASADLPLVPRLRWHEGPYPELLDLLQEFLLPWSGSRVARWDREVLRVAVPRARGTVRYDQAALEAIAVWNEAYGDTLLVGVDATVQEADVEITLVESSRTAWATAPRRSEDGRPLRVVVSIRDDYPPGTERYIRRTLAHELGHALGLWGHSRWLEHLVNGRAVIVDRPHGQELLALRLLRSLPQGFDLATVDRRATAVQVDDASAHVFSGPIESTDETGHPR